MEEEGEGGVGRGAKGEVVKDREAVAPLFFMWKSYSAGVYDQLPGCFHSRIYKPPSLSLTHTHTSLAMCYLVKGH